MIQESSIDMVAGQFFTNPTKEMYLKQVSSNIHLAHTSVKQGLNMLKSKAIIIEVKQKKGTRTFPVYKANRDNPDFRKLKQIYNFKSIARSEVIEYIEKTATPSCVVIFGSYQRGEDIEDSDIDIFIEAKEKNINLKPFERILGRKIQLHWNPQFKAYAKELKNNIANGWIMYGYLEIL